MNSSSTTKAAAAGVAPKRPRSEEIGSRSTTTHTSSSFGLGGTMTTSTTVLITPILPVLQKIENEAREAITQIGIRAVEMDQVLEQRFGKPDEPLSTEMGKIQIHYKQADGTIATSSSPVSASSSESRVVASNPALSDLVSFITEELNWAINRLWRVERWMQLRVPKKEDGNNFGVEVLLECSRTINDRTNLLANYLESLPNYYANRASVIEKVGPRPAQRKTDAITHQVTEWKQSIPQGVIEDYNNFLCQHDLRQWWTLREMARAIQDSYLMVYDVVVKNQDKIENPRTDVAHHQMY